MEKIKKKHKFNIEKIIKVVFVLYIFILCTTWASTIKYNNAPDEAMKYDVCEYLFEHKQLPHGGDEEIREKNWGLSYAFTPIFSYMLSAVFMIITSLFTDNGNTIFLSTRIVSIIFMTAYAFMALKISGKLFKGIYKWLFTVFITLLPQMVFLGSYLNNDAFALFTVSLIVYSWLLGLESNWNWKSCIMMAIGIGLCALSYYNAYGYILCSIIIYFASGYIKKMNLKEFLKKGTAIALIAFAIGGWWFIRNFIIYDGDIFGLDISREYGELYAIPGLKPSQRPTPNNIKISLNTMLFELNWVKSTANSFIAGFRNMDVFMKPITYKIYKTIFAIGFIGLIQNAIMGIVKRFKNKDKEKTNEDKMKSKEKILFNIIMVLNIIIPIALSLYYSYFNDFQAQGRYIMPMIIPFMYFVTKGIKFLFDNIIRNKKIINVLLTIFIILWSIMPIYIYFKYIRVFL